MCILAVNKKEKKKKRNTTHVQKYVYFRGVNSKNKRKMHVQKHLCFRGKTEKKEVVLAVAIGGHGESKNGRKGSKRVNKDKIIYKTRSTCTIIHARCK